MENDKQLLLSIANYLSNTPYKIDPLPSDLPPRLTYTGEYTTSTLHHFQHLNPDIPRPLRAEPCKKSIYSRSYPFIFLPSLTRSFKPKFFRLNHLASVKGHCSFIYNCFFDKTGLLFFTGGDDASIKIWNSGSGFLKKTIKCTSASALDQLVIVDMAVSECNTMLAAAYSDCSIRIYSLATYRQTFHVILSHIVCSIVFHPMIHSLFVACGDGTVRIFDSASARQIDELKPTIQSFKIKSISFNDCGTRLAFGRDDGFVYLYAFDGSKWVLLANLKHEREIVEVIFSNRGDRVLASDKSGNVKLWGFDVGECKWKCVSSLCFINLFS